MECTSIRKLKTICTLCGASPVKDEGYARATITLGKKIIKRKLDLVYGKGNLGLMDFMLTAVCLRQGYV